MRIREGGSFDGESPVRGTVASAGDLESHFSDHTASPSAAWQ